MFKGLGGDRVGKERDRLRDGLVAGTGVIKGFEGREFEGGQARAEK